jgi:hypothetical protein
MGDGLSLLCACVGQVEERGHTTVIQMGEVGYVMGATSSTGNRVMVVMQVSRTEGYIWSWGTVSVTFCCLDPSSQIMRF